MNDEKWFAVYTSPRWEKKVTESLTRKKFVTYCPLNKIPRQWSDRRKILAEPLFLSYVFVYAREEDQSAILQTAGVMSFVYWLGKPAVIRNEEIESIRDFLNEYSQVSLEKTNVNHNEQVKIVTGPTMFRKGNLLEVRNSSARITLPSLGYSIFAEPEQRTEQTESISYLQGLRDSQIKA